MNQILKRGKLPHPLLLKLLRKFGETSALVGPSIGEDAAIVLAKDSAFIFTLDPITFTDKKIGHYLLSINANDIAACGGIPKYLLVSLLFPRGTKEKQIKNLFSEIQKESKKAGLELLGGHTEITDEVKKTIAIGMMIGIAKKDQITPTENAKVGDKILLTKQVAIEGTATIFQEKEKRLKLVFPPKIFKRGKALLFEPGISIVKEAKILNQHCQVNSLHDPTEGGIATALWEISQAAQVKILVDEEKIPILKETQAVCEYYHLDPLYLLASGSLLATLPKKEAEKGVKILRKKGIPAIIIGEVKKGKGTWLLQKNNKLRKILPKEDEITKIAVRDS
ncbi:hypothetical protein COY29_00115 [Candidatus Woesebacteria bacterium CG_4_10_14_0_2_um_filter_39_14]|uniref:Hydrogenase expression/formation protein n=2 Tax=Microgenomates group TaxID=1794810 RepID=A0A2M7XLE0_9BACT|nr:MAG: hypothetical protein COY29_00115 [Candidatus Woesebacteria bacterium CG_4_10_14_0_2_um_filter_39_14]PJA49432.1 MAG: hypothetical protein CO169_01990 [Candidatus Shapirobacteria bacterium CG_4_9_14_3_um_filter_39_13]